MSLHATICRYDDVTGSTEDLALAGRQLASALSAAPGFVSYALLDAGDGVLVSVSVFEERTDLEAANQLMRAWEMDQTVAPLPVRPQILTGEVVVQKGM